MATKNQHYVPQAYLRAWETKVASKNEPNRQFDGVYYFQKSSLEKGNGLTTEKVLSTSHTYTIKSDIIQYLLGYEEIKKEYLSKINEIFTSRDILPKYDNEILQSNTKKGKYIQSLFEWEFVDKNGSLVKSTPIHNQINNVCCYCLEDKFSSYVESDWPKNLKSFLKHFPVSGEGEKEIQISDTNDIDKILVMMIVMMVRNPNFDFFGLLPLLVDNICSGLIDKSDIVPLKRALWLGQIYKCLYDDEKSLLRVMSKKAYRDLGIVLLRVKTPSEGSFITTDCPVVEHSQIIVNPSGKGIYFPLSSNHLIFIGRNSESSINNIIFRTVDNGDIRKINRILLNATSTSLVSKEKYLGHIL